MGMPATDTIDLRAMWYSENQYTAEFFGGAFQQTQKVNHESFGGLEDMCF